MHTFVKCSWLLYSLFPSSHKQPLFSTPRMEKILVQDNILPCAIFGMANNAPLANSTDVNCLHAFSTCVECTHVTSSKLAMSVYVFREQLRHHQPLVYMLACSKYFAVHVVCVLFYMQVFKSSCITTVAYVCECV